MEYGNHAIPQFRKIVEMQHHQVESFASRASSHTFIILPLCTRHLVGSSLLDHEITKPRVLYPEAHGNGIEKKKKLQSRVNSSLVRYVDSWRIHVYLATRIDLLDLHIAGIPACSTSSDMALLTTRNHRRRRL